MFAVQPNELPVSLLTQWSDCAVFIIGISFAFHISWWRYLKPRISPAFLDAATPTHSNSLWFPLKCLGRKHVVFGEMLMHHLNNFKHSVSINLHGAIFSQIPCDLTWGLPERGTRPKLVRTHIFGNKRHLCTCVHGQESHQHTTFFSLMLSHRQLCQGHLWGSTYP